MLQYKDWETLELLYLGELYLNSENCGVNNSDVTMITDKEW